MGELIIENGKEYDMEYDLTFRAAGNDKEVWYWAGDTPSTQAIRFRIKNRDERNKDQPFRVIRRTLNRATGQIKNRTVTKQFKAGGKYGPKETS